MRVIAVARASNTTQQNPAPIYLQSNPQGTLYANNLKCSFLLIAPRYNYINLNFERFAVESGTNCPYDSLQVRARHARGRGCDPRSARRSTRARPSPLGSAAARTWSSCAGRTPGARSRPARRTVTAI